MRDHMHPPRMSAPSCIVPPSEQMIIRSYLVPLLPQFHGMENENPYIHIKDFEEVCHTFQEGTASIDLMRLKLFPFTLKNKAKRYMEAVNACPHHGFDTWISWDEPHGKDSSKVKLQNNSKGGMYTLNEDVDVQAKIATLLRDWKNLKQEELMKSKCFPFSNTFNPGWRNHPNLSWKSGQEQFSSNMQTSQPQASPLAISKLTSMPMVQEKGKFLSQPQQNPREFMKSEKKNENSAKVDEVKAIITLRGGKQVDQPMPKSKENKGGEQEENVKEQEKWKEVNEDDRPKKDEIVNEEVKKEDKLLSPPFPKALHSRKVVNNATEIFEVLKQTELNINKKAFLTEQVSAIIQCKTPIKYKDPRCPTISVNIRDTYVEKAILDLGASVNLLPYSVYKQLGLGELKPTSITLSLDDRSIKISRGMIEDVLVQVDKFYYPVDFIVLDTEPIAREPNHVPIILGRPFLATTNALINCRNGIEIALEDQEKTTFTCPFGTYAYRRMPFGLCNALATFQRCMLKKGIVLGHVISKKDIEVDKVKIKLIVNLPPPTNVKEVRQFLGHAGFYRRFIKDFSKLARPMCALLDKDAKFKWDENCQHCFEELKILLTTTPIVRRPKWTYLLKLRVMQVIKQWEQF
ncbi:Retrovirus-related Pol polyprotein from transposon 17.6 [Vitis vinifera]|uniref:Retrovirus-related Pol polyprotein from transposon 17.6 n=1 Tax=Vitis vinifera TaxID=29760 RepID=A0A438G8W1_VITVI|nr:Retrovirus-related Pol polyprotein from transposon 17.6 [Vitis vinifera]